MVNMYDNPAQAQFIDTYVPIPFDQLYQFGQQARADVEKAYNELSGSLARWSDFRSPSAVDTQTWYNETVGKIKPVVEELSNNIELLKTPEGRARIQGAINNVDYGLLGNLRQSAEALTQRQKVNQELMMKGLYDPRWHDVDFANYRTTKDNVFSDVAPLAYQSWKTLSDPYFQQLSDDEAHRLLRREGVWDYYGVSAEDINRVADDKFNEIYNSPYARKALEIARQYNEIPEGMSDRDYIKQQVIQAQQERIHERPELNPLADLNMRLSARTSGSGQQTNPGQAPATLRNMMLYTASEAEAAQIKENPSLFPRTNSLAETNRGLINYYTESVNEYKQLLDAGEITPEAYNKAVAPLYRDAQKYIKSEAQAYSEDVKDLFKRNTGVDPNVSADKLSIPTYYRGATSTLFDISVPNSTAGFRIINEVKATSKISINNHGTAVDAYIRPNSQNLEVASEYLGNVLQSKVKMDHRFPAKFEGETRDLAKDLKKGRINGVLVVPMNRMHNYVDPKTGENKYGQLVEVKLSREALIQAGYEAEAIDEYMELNFGAFPEEGINIKAISQNTVESGLGYEREGGFFNNKEGRNPGAQNTKYYSIIAVDPILGKDADMFSAEQQFMKYNSSATKVKEEYEGNQVDTFDPERKGISIIPEGI